MEENRKKKKIIASCLMGVAIVIIALVCIFIGIPLIKMAGEPDKFRAWVEAKGIWGPVLYVALVIFQILIAFIPGEPLEIVAGYVFGTFKGTLLCIAAASLGSIIVLLLVRKFGKALLEIYFDKEKIESLKFLQSSEKKIIIFLILFIVPGTPKDLLCYYGGLTDISMPLLIFICTVCRFPSIITSTIGGNALGTGEYGFAVIVFAVTAVISAIGIIIYNKFSKKNGDSNVRTD
ncbi:MAG: TVP38/TMEM64 family protein [Lachnospiraceae bacterium]|nr:TVP38/TMEM64 family protein [Lachnospiraceae bacterium]MBR4815700.1 TVP38/TMEM64 family protein [Lachnospiraceae bacterium]